MWTGHPKGESSLLKADSEIIFDNQSTFCKVRKNYSFLVERFTDIVYLSNWTISSYKYWNNKQHPFNGHLSGTTRVSWYQKGKTSLDLLEQETVSGSGISWAICKPAPRPKQITTPAPHHWNILNCYFGIQCLMQTERCPERLEMTWLHKQN